MATLDEQLRASAERCAAAEVEQREAYEERRRLMLTALGVRDPETGRRAYSQEAVGRLLGLGKARVGQIARGANGGKSK